MGSSVTGAIVATLATLQHITRLETKLLRRKVLGGTRRIQKYLSGRTETEMVATCRPEESLVQKGEGTEQKEGDTLSPLPLPCPPSSCINVFNQVAQLTPHLYLAAATALTPEVVARYQVTLVLNVTEELPLLCLEGARSMRVNVTDSTTTNLYQEFDNICTTIREEAARKGAVLVHCVAGVSRSATLCLAYLIRYYCSLEEAWSHVKTIRPWIRPNYSFMEQLLEWEKVVRPNSDRSQLSSLQGAEVRRRRKELIKGTKTLPSQPVPVAALAERGL